MRRHFGAVFTSARRGPSPNSTIHSVGRSRVDACGRRDQPESRSYKTRECRDESASIRRASRGPRQGRARCEDREPDRCAGEDHEHQHLRLGPAHVRRPHRSGARDGPRSRKLGHRRRSRQCRGSRKAGDRVCLPFNIGCGFCRNCEEGLDRLLPDGAPRIRRWPAPHTASPGWDRSAGGQAESLRVPFGDFNCLLLPRGRPGQGKRLRDALGHLPHRMALHPTGRHATRRFDGGLRRRPGRFDGRVFGDDPGREQGDDRRPPPRPADAWPKRSASSRSTTRRATRVEQVLEQTNGQAPTRAANASAIRRTTRKATRTPP